MDWKWFFSIFGSVLLAEMADKTQLATVLFAAGRPGGKLIVFAAAALALVTATAIAVAFGSALANYIEPRMMSVSAGVIFIGLGVYMLWQGLSLS
ncbi:MAG: TMEM165/GDT1 family protein [Xanthomonadales bacterium]|nr:TMEM165/GDT1 family protein [Xanthomonadales bacterium]